MQTIAVTGGNGKLGRAILKTCSEDGYRTVNIARGKQRESVSDEYRTTDLTDAGQVYGSLSMAEPDAIVHAGTIPRPNMHPGYVTFLNNVASSYHVLESAEALDISSVCLASSINAIGGYWQEQAIEVSYLPVDEDHPATPRDPYGLAKHVIEQTADGFGRRDGSPETISSLRYPWIATDDELREAFQQPERTINTVDHDHGGGGGRDDLFSYVQIDDAARATRCALEAEFTGHERFWIVAEDTTMDTPTPELTKYYNTDSKQPFSGHQSLIDISKADRLLDWQPRVSWRDE